MNNLEPETRSVRQLLLHARELLATGAIEDPEIEAELLLRLALSGDNLATPTTRPALYLRLKDPADGAVAARLDALLRRRLAHEPTAYIGGHREFYGLDLTVTPAVLIPRPETELLVDSAIELTQACSSTAPSLIDAGTGSGAIAVALAGALPAAAVYATDVSFAALDVARANARRHDAEHRISFRHGDLLLPLDRRVDVIVANLPYVTTADWTRLPPELREHEPRLALDGGDDGLEPIRRLLHQAPSYLNAAGAICLEFGAGQAEMLLQAARRAMPASTMHVINDFAGIPRVLVIRS